MAAVSHFYSSVGRLQPADLSRIAVMTADEGKREAREVQKLRSRHSVFSLNNFPNLIFKRLLVESSNCETEKYYHAIVRAKNITRKMDRLVVPETVLMTHEVRKILVQEKLEITDSDGAEEKRYSEKGHKRAIAQLTKFICHTGFFDVEYRNISMLKDGRIALIDLEPEWMGDTSKGLTNLIKCVGKIYKWTVIWAAFQALWYRPWKWLALYTLCTKGIAEHNKVQNHQREVNQFLKRKKKVDIEALDYGEFGADSNRVKEAAKKIFTVINNGAFQDIRKKWLSYKAHKFLFWHERSEDPFYGQGSDFLPKTLKFLARHRAIFAPSDGRFGFWQAYA